MQITSSHLRKQVERISEGTNIPIQSRINSTFVTHASFRNVDVGYSTNLIPLSLLTPDGKAEDGPAPSATDELDWILDQISLPGTFPDNDFVLPANGDPANPLTMGRRVQQVHFNTKSTCKHLFFLLVALHLHYRLFPYLVLAGCYDKSFEPILCVLS